MSRNDFSCVDCGVNTSEIEEYYMVHNHVWPLKKTGHESNMADNFKDMTTQALHEERRRILKRLERLRLIANNYRRKLGTITTVLKNRQRKYEKYNPSRKKGVWKPCS